MATLTDLEIAQSLQRKFDQENMQAMETEAKDFEYAKRFERNDRKRGRVNESNVNNNTHKMQKLNHGRKLISNRISSHKQVYDLCSSSDEDDDKLSSPHKKHNNNQIVSKQDGSKYCDNAEKLVSELYKDYIDFLTAIRKKQIKFTNEVNPYYSVITCQQCDKTYADFDGDCDTNKDWYCQICWDAYDNNVEMVNNNVEIVNNNDEMVITMDEIANNNNNNNNSNEMDEIVENIKLITTWQNGKSYESLSDSDGVGDVIMNQK
eukprot:517484_1